MRLRSTALLAVVLGMAWHTVAFAIFGADLEAALSWPGLAAGACAGIAATLHTLWSRRREDGRETLLHGLTTYYLGIFVYGIVLVALLQVDAYMKSNDWPDFSLCFDYYSLIVMCALLMGTIWWGPLLGPLCFLSRRLVWIAYPNSNRVTPCGRRPL